VNPSFHVSVANAPAIAQIAWRLWHPAAIERPPQAAPQSSRSQKARRPVPPARGGSTPRYLANRRSEPPSLVYSSSPPSRRSFEGSPSSREASRSGGRAVGSAAPLGPSTSSTPLLAGRQVPRPRRPARDSRRAQAEQARPPKPAGRATASSDDPPVRPRPPPRGKQAKPPAIATSPSSSAAESAAPELGALSRTWLNALEAEIGNLRAAASGAWWAAPRSASVWPRPHALLAGQGRFDEAPSGWSTRSGARADGGAGRCPARRGDLGAIGILTTSALLEALSIYRGSTAEGRRLGQSAGGHRRPRRLRAHDASSAASPSAARSATLDGRLGAPAGRERSPRRTTARPGSGEPCPVRVGPARTGAPPSATRAQPCSVSRPVTSRDPLRGGRRLFAGPGQGNQAAALVSLGNLSATAATSRGRGARSSRPQPLRRLDARRWSPGRRLTAASRRAGGIWTGAFRLAPGAAPLGARRRRRLHGRAGSGGRGRFCRASLATSGKRRISRKPVPLPRVHYNPASRTA
jgi:hypothetical protein